MNIDHAIDTRNDVALLGADQCDDTVLILETVHRWLCHVPLGIVRVEFDVEIDCVVKVRMCSTEFKTYHWLPALQVTDHDQHWY